MKKTIVFFLVITTNVFADIPTLDITFGGPLANSCQFVSNQDVIASLYSTLSVLNQIETKRDECQSLLVNSRVYLKNLVNLNKLKNENINVALANQKYLQDLIASMTLNGTYTGQYNVDLVNTQKDIARLKNKTQMKSDLILNTLNMGESIFSSLEANPSCNSLVAAHVVAPSIAVMGNILSLLNMTVNPIYGAVSSFLSTSISYFGRIFTSSYRAKEALTESANYFLSYKCAFNNIENLLCKIKEENEYSVNSRLDILEKKIMDIDKADSFKKLRDLIRHRYRITDIINKLEKIFNSPETSNDLKEIATYQAKISNLSDITKLPPFKNRHYLEAKGITSMPIGVWDGWDANIISWPKRFYSYFFLGKNDFLSSRVKSYCGQLKTIAPSIQYIWSDISKTCSAGGLYKSSDIDLFIKVAITPALLDLENEISRINDKVKRNPNVDNLYSSIKSQHNNLGNPNYREYTLENLLLEYISYAKKYANSSAAPFARDIKLISQNILKLVNATLSNNAASQNKGKSFKDIALEVYSSIAEISNSGRKGGILYTSIIESKISSFFDQINESLLYNQDPNISKSYVMFNYLADLHRGFSANLDREDSFGADNQNLMLDVQGSFIKVFSKIIIKKLTDSYSKYKHNKLSKKDLIHSCAIYLPFFYDKKMMLSSYKMKRFCTKLLRDNNGIAFLRGDTVKYPLNPAGAASFKEHCYYYNYSRESIARKIYLYNKRSNHLRF